MQEWWQTQRVTLAVALASFALGAGLTLLFGRPEPPPIRVIQPTSVPTPGQVVVHVSGAVSAPGVYDLPASARVVDAVEAAGGATAEGNPHALNLAARLRDGQLVLVPGMAESGQVDGAATAAQANPSLPSEPAKIDLNRADEAQLDSLPGVGPVTVQRILDFRAREGGFQRVEQLLEARLVNSATFDRIKELVEVP